MEHPQLVSGGSFCWKPDCPDYGKIGQGNIIKFGRTKKGTQRFQCKTCGKTSVETKGTVFYGRHHSPEPFWNAWRGWPNGTAWLLFIGSKGSRKRQSWTG